MAEKKGYAGIALSGHVGKQSTLSELKQKLRDRKSSLYHAGLLLTGGNIKDVLDYRSDTVRNLSPQGKHRSLDAVLEVELIEDIFEVVFDGVLSDLQFIGNLFIR